VAFEIGFELGGFASVLECHGYLQFPGPVLSGVTHVAGVMTAEAIFQIVGQPDVMARRIGLAHEKVHMEKFIRGSRVFGHSAQGRPIFSPAF
jgi:hypothetical protein